MKRVLIIFLGFTIAGAFSAMEGDWFLYNLFPFSTHQMIWPEYLSILTKYLAVCGGVWTLYLQETERPREMLIAALLITGMALDFVLECNQSRVILGIRINYYTLAAIVFGVITFRVIHQTLKDHGLI